MPDIFLSYRRMDAAGTAALLCDRLSQHFGAARVFRDIDSIEAGDDFEQSIRDALRTVQAVLVVIGSKWVDLRGDDGARRIDQPGDYVRREIEIALASDAIVIPVLLENAALPTAEQLPASIRELAKRNAVQLSNRNWEKDVEDFMRRLEARGIPAAESRESGSVSTRTPTHGRVVASALVGFVPNLFSLLYQPRRFLARCTQGRAADLTAAFTFFLIALLLAIAFLISVYTPAESAVTFTLAVLAIGLVATLSLSVLLWAAWRLAGATRHYFRLLVVLLHQVAGLHLIVFVIMSMMLFALDLRSRNVAREMMDDVLKPGSSARAALATMSSRLEPLVSSSEVRIGLVLTGLFLAAGLIWIVRSWGAYRDAFGLGRARSVAAVIFSALIAWAAVTLVGLVA